MDAENMSDLKIECEFLKQRVLKDVLDEADQYGKTTLKEINRFENFIKSCPPFDIVIDALNITKMFPKIRESQTLLDVVSQITKQNLQVLVLGSKHMLNGSSRWQKNEMAAVQNMAYCFFADNVSEDDAFLLYATLHSGNHCRFLTRDLLQDHKACLPDDKTRHLFFRWQQGHQLVFLNYHPGKKIIFQSVLTYDTVVQTTGDSWHIPLNENMVENIPMKYQLNGFVFSNKTDASSLDLRASECPSCSRSVIFTKCLYHFSYCKTKSFSYRRIDNPRLELYIMLEKKKIYFCSLFKQIYNFNKQFLN